MAQPHPPEESQNDDLFHFTNTARNLWSDHGQTILLGLLIVLIPLTVYIWYIGRQRQVDEAAWRELAMATSPAALADVADAHRDSAVRALARLAAADQLLYLAITPAPPKPVVTPDSPEAPAAPERPEVEPTAALKEAAMLYQQVIDDPNLHRLYHLNALQGLASVAESQGQWDKARELWQQVAQRAGEDYNALMVSAQARLARLESIQRPVWFGPEAPAPEATKPPAVEAQGASETAAEPPSAPEPPATPEATPTPGDAPAEPAAEGSSEPASVEPANSAEPAPADAAETP